MAYFKLNTEGTIQSRTTNPDGTWLKLELLALKEDGSYYIYYLHDMEDGKYVPDLVKEYKTYNDARVLRIKQKANELIESKYPIYKQINITNLLTPYTEEDRDVMKAFIDSKRAIRHKAIADGTKAEDVDFSDEP